MSDIVSFRIDSEGPGRARAAVLRVEREVAAAYADRLSHAGWLNRLILKYRMQSELNRRLEKLAVLLPYYFACDARQARDAEQTDGQSG